jgi:hypothetical protein
MAKSKLLCSWCSNTFDIENKYFNQKTKEGQRNFYCSRICEKLDKQKRNVLNNETVPCKKCSALFVRNKKLKRQKQYCSVTCANSHIWTLESRKKLSESAKHCAAQKRGNFPSEKERLTERKCKNCNVLFLAKKHSPKGYCSANCCKITRKYNKNLGGYREGSGRAKTGYYKGIYCGSTYELAFLIWNLDQHANIKRCEKTFLYNNGRKYHPDFEIDEEIIEIKGYHTPDVDLKEKAVLEQQFRYRILYKKDIQHMIDYVKTKHKIKYLPELYETAPIYRFVYICASCGSEIKCNVKRKSEYKFCSRKCLNPHIKSSLTTSQSIV